MDLRALKIEHRKLVEKANGILKVSEDEKRDLTAEESNSFDKIMDDADKLKDKILKLERLEQEKRNLALVEGEVVENRVAEKPEEIQKRAFENYLKHGKKELSQEEVRSLQADVSAQAGYIVAPQNFISEIIKQVNDIAVIRQFATVKTLTDAHSLGVPYRKTRASDADWTSEIGAAQEETTLDYGKRTFEPHQLKKFIKISEKLLLLSNGGAEREVREEFAYKFGITEEKAFMTGNGSQQPLGLFTASNDGISTSQDVSTGNTSTGIRFDGLIEAKYSLKPQWYNRPNTRWVFHRDAIKQIRKLKDGEGQYIWEESVVVGRPSMILGIPVVQSEYAPNTFTTGQYVGLLGDLSYYWIADTMKFTIVRLNELYRINSQIGYIGTLWVDGCPVLEEAFARVKLA